MENSIEYIEEKIEEISSKILAAVAQSVSVEHIVDTSLQQIVELNKLKDYVKNLRRK